MTRSFRFVPALIALSASALAAQGAPTVATFQQALEKKLQKLKPDYAAERNVLFQAVQPGRPTGATYPFRATVLIRDYGAGYPPNRYYGRTCVGRLEEEVFTLEPDQFGGWDVQGRMTPDMSKQTCKDNPSAGVSSIPLASLSGTAAPTGQQAPPAASQRGAAASSDVAQGAYECWGNGEARMLMNFTIRGGGQYVDSEGKTGTYRVDPRTGRITFTGGLLDGVMPPGFYAVYTISQGRPRVSFRNSGGSEAQYCEKK